jgi:hypothetical protein
MSAAFADPAQASAAAVARPEIVNSFFMAEAPQVEVPSGPKIPATPGLPLDAIKSDESISVHERRSN